MARLKMQDWKVCHFPAVLQFPGLHFQVGTFVCNFPVLHFPVLYFQRPRFYQLRQQRILFSGCRRGSVVCRSNQKDYVEEERVAAVARANKFICSVLRCALGNELSPEPLSLATHQRLSGLKRSRLCAPKGLLLNHVDYCFVRLSVCSCILNAGQLVVLMPCCPAW